MGGGDIFWLASKTRENGGYRAKKNALPFTGGAWI